MRASSGLLVILLICVTSFGQSRAQSINWQNKDLVNDSLFGISLDKARALLKLKKKPKPLIVAVLDGGVDIGHEALKKSIWINKKEIPHNLIDDDHNGFTDDINGWNFLATPVGDIDQDNLEVTRIIRYYKYKYKTEGQIPLTEKPYYKNAIAYFEKRLATANNMVTSMEAFKSNFENLVLRTGETQPLGKNFYALNPDNPIQAQIVKMVTQNVQPDSSLKKFEEQFINIPLRYFKDQLKYGLNMDFDPRATAVGIQPKIGNTGNGINDVKGPHPDHGTSTSGLIAARVTGKGKVEGVAPFVQILAVRVLPGSGDERDADVANGIIYAVQNGAKIINLSFSKSFSPQKDLVDSAVRFAMKKDVLIIHGAGNDGIDIDKDQKYPNRYYAASGTAAEAWIEVGASGPHNDTTLVPFFSNYGKNSVDLFAPGVQITSTTPGSGYKKMDGTSLSAPIVTGVAAILRAYYPQFKATQIRTIINQSVSKPQHPVIISTNGVSKKLTLTDICRSGGVVNIYKAVLLADSMTAISQKRRNFATK